MLDTVKINHVQHISFTQSRLTDAVSVILSELLLTSTRLNAWGTFFCRAVGAGACPAREPSPLYRFNLQFVGEEFILPCTCRCSLLHGLFCRGRRPRRPGSFPPTKTSAAACGQAALQSPFPVVRRAGCPHPPQVHVAVRFPFSHRPQHQLQPVLTPAEIRGGVPALEHPRQGRVSQMAPAQRVAPFHKTVR